MSILRRCAPAAVRTFSALGRNYVVFPGVFDPDKHLSGMLVAHALASEGDRWENGVAVLELGTGCGLLSGVLHDLGASVVATDVSTIACRCARHNLANTAVDVRCGDLFAPVEGERFDAIVMNPPYEIGRSLLHRYSSPAVLERLAAQWRTFADQLVLAFPTDSSDVLVEVGFDLVLTDRLSSPGRELGIFRSTG